MWFAGPAPQVPVVRRGALAAGLNLSRGQRVGVLGGSFNPAHDGHAHVAETAAIRLGLDRVIWLVSPQNPLKDARHSAPLNQRIASAERVARGPRMIVSDLESRIGVRYTIDTLRVLKARYPGVRFVWIMGGDNLSGFHCWRGWTEIFHLVPIAVVARPGALSKSRFAPAARRFAWARLHSREGLTLADRPPASLDLSASAAQPPILDPAAQGAGAGGLRGRGLTLKEDSPENPSPSTGEGQGWGCAR